MTKRQTVYGGVNDSLNVTSGWYDGLNRPQGWENTGAGDSMFARSWQKWDSVGRMIATWRDEQGGKGERFYYAPTNQLTNVGYNGDQVWTDNPVNWGRWVDYGYQPGMLNRWYLNDNGNFSWVSAGNLNQYTTIGEQTLEYDERFNLKSYAGATFNYNAQNQLVSASKGTNTVQFVYDGLGRCLKRITNGASIIFAYDGWKPLAEWAADGSYWGYRIYGSGPDELLWQYDSRVGYMRVHSDAHGNVIALLDWNGNGIEKYTYDAFGTPKITDWAGNVRTTSTVLNRFMYTGREYIQELGIYDYRHRMYHPGLGRFLQADPMGFDAGDMNLFRYCDDDPVDRSDPTGLEFFPRDVKEVEAIKGEPGLSGLTIPDLKLSIQRLRTPDGYALQSKVDVIIIRKEVATTINGRPLSREGIDQLKVHEDRHERTAKEWHDGNQNKIPSGPFKTVEAAAKGAKEAGDKLRADFDSKMGTDHVHKPDSVWKKILEQDKLKVR